MFLVEPLSIKLLGEKNRGPYSILLALQAEVHPNIQDEHGRTALYMVFSNSYDSTINNQQQDKKMVEILLKAGANPNIRTDRGRTTLYSAAEKQYTEIVGLLLEAGADPNRPSNISQYHINKIAYDKLENKHRSEYPLYLSVMKKNEEMTWLLLKAGADSKMILSKKDGTQNKQIEAFIKQVKQEKEKLASTKEVTE